MGVFPVSHTTGVPQGSPLDVPPRRGVFYHQFAFRTTTTDSPPRRTVTVSKTKSAAVKVLPLAAPPAAPAEVVVVAAAPPVPIAKEEPDPEPILAVAAAVSLKTETVATGGSFALSRGSGGEKQAPTKDEAKKQRQRPSLDDNMVTKEQELAATKLKAQVSSVVVLVVFFFNFPALLVFSLL